MFSQRTLAEGSVVAAGNLMREDTEPWLIYAGGPLRAVKRRKSGTYSTDGERDGL